MVVAFRELALQGAAGVDPCAQQHQRLVRGHGGDRRRAVDHQVEGRCIADLLQPDPGVDGLHAHGLTAGLEVENAQRRHHQLRATRRQAGTLARITAFQVAGAADEVHTRHKGAAVVARQHHIKALGQPAQRADAHSAGAAQLGLGLVAHHHGVEVAVTVYLQGRQDGKVEEVDLPINEVDHVRQVHPGRGRFDVFVVGGGQHVVACGVDHAARTRDPPEARRLHQARQVAGRHLDVGNGADDDFFAIGHVARQQHGQGLAQGGRLDRSGHFRGFITGFHAFWARSIIGSTIA